MRFRKLSDNMRESRSVPSAFVAGLLGLSICIAPTAADADRGVIALTNSKCFVIETLMGYVLVDGWVNVPRGTVVIGDFNTYGSVKIFDINGNDVSGYTYIEEWGLSKSAVLEKWDDKCVR